MEPQNCWFGSMFLLFQGGYFQVSGVRFLGFVVSTEIIRKWCDTVKKDLHLLLLLLDGHAGHFVCAAGSLSRLGNLERCMTPSTEQSRLFFEAVDSGNWCWVAFYLACFLLVPVFVFCASCLHHQNHHPSLPGMRSTSSGGECSPEWPGQQHRYHESGWLTHSSWVERGGLENPVVPVTFLWLF